MDAGETSPIKRPRKDPVKKKAKSSAGSEDSTDGSGSRPTSSAVSDLHRDEQSVNIGDNESDDTEENRTEGDGSVMDELNGVLKEDPMDPTSINRAYDNGSDDDEDDDEEEAMYRNNWNSIRSHHRVGQRVQDVYNFRIGGAPVLEQVGRGEGNDRMSLVERRLRAIFSRQSSSFKINMSYGFILRHTETGQLRYFHSSANNHRYFDQPHLITNQDDMDRFISAVLLATPLDYAIRHRPNTKWTVVLTTNVTFYLNKLAFAIGAGGCDVPPYIKNNPAIVSLQKHRHTGRPYTDQLCFFRCLALQRGCPINHLERDTKYYLEKYLERYPTKSPFVGVTLEDLPDLETLFEVNIQVFTLVECKDKEAEDETNEEEEEEEGTDDSEEDETGEEEGDEEEKERNDDSAGESQDQESHQPREKQQNITSFIVWRTHRRYTETMNLHLQGHHFSFIKSLKLYSKTYRCFKCDRLFRLVYRLNRHEVTCDGNVRHVFPGGAYTSPSTIFDKLRKEDIEVDEELKYFPHRATYDFECYFQDPTSAPSASTTKLKVNAVHVPLSVSIASNVPGFEDVKHFITTGDSRDLVDRMVTYLEIVSVASKETLQDSYSHLFEALDEKIEDLKLRKDLDDKIKLKRERQLERLKTELDTWLTELPVLGFNSSRYDLNLIKSHLYPILVTAENLKIIKKGSAYQCLQTGTLKFLDVLNYLAPGYSYRHFLKAYGAEDAKGFFPYEWLDRLSKLDHTELPPHEAFYSTLKGTNISPEEYAYCQAVWSSKKMKTMRDFLRWYNDLDVTPFLTALQNMFDFYQSLNIDMFKEAISVPGLTLKYLFNTLDPQSFFTLFKDKDRDLFYKMRNNIVGGPSIIFHRHHESGVTRIRDGDKMCKEVLGFDANALYLWSLMQKMPTGPYIRRSHEDNFKPVHAYSHGEMAVQWLDWIASTENSNIQHMFNKHEKRVGYRQIPVDGFCRESNTVYQFHGCYFHGHQCVLNKKDYNVTKGCSMTDLRQQTAEISAYIRSEGYNLVEIYECEWMARVKTDQGVQSFIHTRQRPLRKKRSLSVDQIVRAIREDTLFGVIECDIHVPEHLLDHFAEMPPIFKNCNVGKEDIGDHMRNFADEHGLLNQPRRTLIGSMKGEKIMLITPLLKWYLEHGLQITDVYEVIEYHPSACFLEFAETVVDARRQGDVDPSKAVVAETMKLIGNSAYGKTITNKEKFRNISICSDSEAPLLINSQHFRQLNQVGEDVCEVEMSKKSIKMDLPIQIGFFVYGYAKLRMLAFYYDFIAKYIAKEDFQYCAMDTDSAYIALSGPFDSLIKPTLQDEFEKERHNWLPRTDTEEHRRFDKRQPGLFKEEWRGNGIVSLCSKTYYCFGDVDKYSCKGVNKKQQNPLTASRYLDVLKNHLYRPRHKQRIQDVERTHGDIFAGERGATVSIRQKKSFRRRCLHFVLRFVNIRSFLFILLYC